MSRFPELESLESVLATDAARAIKDLAPDRLDDYLAYQAYPTSRWQDLSSKPQCE